MPITSSSRKSQTKATVFSNKRITILPYSNIAIPIAGLKRRQLELPNDRDLIFEPYKLETLSVYAYIVDYRMTKVFVRNNTDRPISLLAKRRLETVTDYEAAGYFTINSSHYNLASRAPKRSLNWIKTGIRKLVAAAAIFSAAIALIVTEKIYSTGVTIHSTAESQDAISSIVSDFSSL